MTTVLSENFDASGSIPATISTDGAYDISSAWANSSPNALRLTGTTTAKWWETAAGGSANGNDQITVYYDFSHASGAAELVEASLSHSGTILGGAGGSGSYFGAVLQMGSTASGIYKWTAGAPVAISWPDGQSTAFPAGRNFSGAFSGGVTYKLIFSKAWDLNGHAWMHARVQRLSDNKWLQCSITDTDGAWKDGQADCLRAQNDTISAASRKAGGLVQLSDVSHAIYEDDVLFETTPAIGWHSYGDSNMAGSDASSPWIIQLNAALMASGAKIVNNLGVGGWQTVDIAACTVTTRAAWPKPRRSLKSTTTTPGIPIRRTNFFLRWVSQIGPRSPIRPSRERASINGPIWQGAAFCAEARKTRAPRRRDHRQRDPYRSGRWGCRIGGGPRHRHRRIHRSGG
jgi:hypothetical protein